MDSTGFDRLAKSLTRAKSRRQVMAGLATALGLSSPALAGAKGQPGPEKKRKRKRPTCQTEQTTAAVINTLVVKRQKLTLTTIDRTPLDPRDDRTSTTTIRQGSKLLLRVDQTISAANHATIRTTYGPTFTGIHEIDFTVDGATVAGTVDGRAIVPFPADSPPDTLQFQDGQPAPEMQVSERVARQLQQILDQGQAAQVTCGPAAGVAAKSRDRHGQVKPQITDEEFACLRCKGFCALADSQCGWAAASACNPTLAIPFIGPGVYAVCLVAALALCIETGFECMQRCRRSTDCCPEQCGTIPDLTCCHGGAHCLTFGTGIGECCEVGFTPCHETTCCAPLEACRDDGGCCRAGTRPCGRSACCKSTETCLNNGSCCATEQVCAGACCPAGQTCDRGRCAVVCNPDRQVTCPNQPGYPICCEKGTTCCQNGLCCIQGWDCCPGSTDGCCAPGLECCPFQGGAACMTSCIH